MDNTRIIHLDDAKKIKKEINKIVSNTLELENMVEKLSFRALKICQLDARAANILKQEAIACGCDAIISEDVFTFNAVITDVILFGQIRQIENLYYRIKTKSFGLCDIAEKVKDVLTKYNSEYEKINKGKFNFDFKRKTHIMGILNITPDSFSDGGKYINLDDAIKKVLKMKEEGADIIDIGAESSRPGAEPVSKEEELERLYPIVKRIMSEIDIPISIDTYKSEVAKELLELGVHIINDITGLKGDDHMAEVISDYDALVVVMHMQGTSKTMQDNPMYEDVVGDIIRALNESIKIAELGGILRKNILVDPGIGFGKNLSHNIEIIRNLDDFKTLGLPILLGASRKSFIGEILDVGIEDRLEGSLAVAALAINKGASILRVHDVKETVRVAKMIDKLKD